MAERQVFFHDLNLIDYQQAWDLQEKLLAETIAQKLANRNLPAAEQITPKNHLIFCEHPHTYTLGKSGLQDHLLLNNEQLKHAEAQFYKINRGGDITYHGPGQLVVYPIFDLEQFFTDIHKYLRLLEQAVIQCLQAYGLNGQRMENLTGVWLQASNNMPARKLCAMGVRCSRWVTMHGLALNVNTDLNYFNNIIPCGISDKAVSSISAELGYKVDMAKLKDLLKSELSQVFDFHLMDA